ncbi:MAG TPA: glycoside hydrolase family 15 protein [Stellaceae bacterium]|nr:glycoside hydrolase family 15 protein [Stellaceae bacterium]
MQKPIEHYGLIGNAHTAALVGLDGSIDWLCLPRFDSGACFTALLGGPENGRWLIAPRERVTTTTRKYRDETAVLETRFETEEGAAVVTDFMPMPDDEHEIDLVRLVYGERGTVRMRTELLFRFDYGRVVPWVRRRYHGLSAIAGPDGVQLRTPVHLRGEDFATRGDFTVKAGELIPFTMTWYPSHHRSVAYRDPEEMLASTLAGWRMWSARCTYQGRWREAVIRSLITLKLLTYHPTGAIVAAPTTSLPEQIGGGRNWDYRYCWIRDATFTLYALMTSGYVEEARSWREWLLRAALGKPSELQIMYGVAGERRLSECELPWLVGYRGSRPVRLGNAAHSQFQLDVYGEVVDALYASQQLNHEQNGEAWELQKALLDYLEGVWRTPDHGLWEMRGPPRAFTHSRMMAWVAFDRAVKIVEQAGLHGPIEHWRELRKDIHAEVCTRGFDAQQNAFVQCYGSKELDAALLLMPHVGFLPPTDSRIIGTVKAVRRNLVQDGLVLRYRTERSDDGLPAGEGSFLACSFWLADALALIGERTAAEELFERLLSLRNDLGLLAEEYDLDEQCLVGNFPQAFSHVALVNTAHNLTNTHGPAKRRGRSRSK